MILDYLKSISAEKYDTAYPFELTARPAYASIDWLTATTSRIDQFEKFIKKFMPLLRGHGFKFFDTGRGLNGYTNCWQITWYDDVCGQICADSLNKNGGMFQLTGKGCQILQARWDLWCLLVAGLNEYGLNIKRLDIAADFKGSVWDKFDFNLVDFLRAYQGGMFTIGSGCGAKPDYSVIGDTADLILGDGSYNPNVQCPNGITLNIGSSTSVNSWCVYEKGKQLAGKNPDRYDGSLSSWVRVERRIRSGSGRGKVVIPFEFAVSPDSALVYNCEGVKSFVDSWLDFQVLEGVEVDVVPVVSLDLKRVGLDRLVSIKKTALHVARQSSRFFKTLEVMGVDVVEFVNLVKSDKCNKGFDLGLYRANSVGSGGDVMDFLRSEYA